MAQISYSPGISLTTGALDSEHKLITRHKHLHGPNGAVTKECKPEVYLQVKKRNYKHVPPMGKELAQAPLGKDGKQRHYFRFDNFIRAMIYQELKD